MPVLKYDMHVGESIEIGEDVCVRIDDKSGRGVRLAVGVAAHVTPIRHRPSGIMPQRFTTGVTGARRVVPITAFG